MKSPRLFLTGLFLALVTALPAALTTQSVAYQHEGVNLVGYLAYDAARVAPHHPGPGVLVVPEWWGLTDYAKSRANQLAELGYVAFVADMYGDGQTTADPKKASELAGQFYGKPLMAERAAAGLRVLRDTGLVDRRLAAIGYCFGGSTVQALAYSGAPLLGVVSFHGGLIPVPADAAKTNHAKLLICHGAVDPFVSKEEVDTFQKAMNDGKFDYQFISYSGAVHAFTNPGADAIAKTTGLPIAYNAAADQRSWAHMRDFFQELFAVKP